MASSKDQLNILNRIAVVRDYAALWQQFFTYFSESLIERQITQEEENEFHNIVSVLALNHYKFQELSKGYFNDAPKVLELIQETANLEYMKNLPEASISKFQVDWHSLFISMHKALGKMLGQLTPKQLAELQNRDEAAG